MSAERTIHTVPVGSTRVEHTHQYLDNGPKINAKLIKNTKGYNFEITVTGAKTTGEAVALIKEAEAALAAAYPNVED